MSKSESTDPVKWWQLHGQMFNRKITRSMLVASVQFVEYVSLKGAKNPKTDKAFKRVEYDRDYVIQVLIKRAIKPLYPMKWNDYQALLSDAYKTYKAELKAQEKENQANQD